MLAEILTSIAEAMVGDTGLDGSETVEIVKTLRNKGERDFFTFLLFLFNQVWFAELCLYHICDIFERCV